MHSIRIDVSDTIYDKVMFFLQHLPKTDIKLYPHMHKPKKDLKELLTIGTFDIEEAKVENWDIQEF